MRTQLALFSTLSFKYFPLLSIGVSLQGLLYTFWKIDLNSPSKPGIINNSE